jgi:type II secretory pathway component PulF
VSEDESLISELALMVAHGELSATAYFEVVDERAAQWVEQELLQRLDEQFTLDYPAVAGLLAGIIGVLFLAALVLAL